MPITPTEQSRAVCLALKLGELCDGTFEEWWGMDRYWECNKCKLQFGGDFLKTPHWKDGERPPDLASPQGADLLMTAVLENGCSFDCDRFEPHGRPMVEFELCKGGKRECGHGPNWRLALLAAAWRLLCEGK